MKRVSLTSTNEIGMSLLETMIAAGVGTALILGTLQSSLMVNQQAKAVSQGGDWDGLVTLIAQTYKNQIQCVSMFGGTGGLVIPGQNSFSVNLNDLGVKDSSGVYLGKFLTVGQNVNGFTAKSITLSTVSGNQTQTLTTSTQSVWVDQVFLTFRATKSTTSPSGASASPGASPTGTEATLVSGAESTSADAISFTLYRQATAGAGQGKVISCSLPLDSSQEACENIGEDSVYLTSPDAKSTDGRLHTSHGHSKCQIRSLNLNPRRDLAKGGIVFGESTALEKITGDSSVHSLALTVNGLDAMTVAYDLKIETTNTPYTYWKCLTNNQTFTSSTACLSVTTVLGYPFYACPLGSYSGSTMNNRCAQQTGINTTKTSSPDAIVTFNGGITNVAGKLAVSGNTDVSQLMKVNGTAIVPKGVVVSGTLTAPKVTMTGGNIPHDCYVSRAAGPFAKCQSNEVQMGGGTFCRGNSVIKNNYPMFVNMFYLPDPNQPPTGWVGTCWDVINNKLDNDATQTYAICCPQ